MRRIFSLFAIVIVSMNVLADEGMFPMSELSKVNFKDRGIELTAEDIFNPGKVSLSDAIISLGGCTASFVSDKGLIFTNHHCAYRAVNAASTEEYDYLQNGFYAENFSDEVPAVGYTVRITEKYEDVSVQVLSVVNDNMGFAEKTKAIEKKIKEIERDAEAANPGMRAGVAEMFIGKSYMLYLYTYLKDVRLVYVPPVDIGNYGGETDNWVWPRHTGDFSFLRAYVGPDGQTAEYSTDNIPYTPKRVLQVNPEGVDENDAVFILGYPGRTYRHRTSYYMDYQENLRMPYIANLYEWEIHLMEELGKDDRSIALKHSSRIKGLANTMKNYKGKLKGLKKLTLTQKKRDEEKKLQDFIKDDKKRDEAYGTILSDIKSLIHEMSESFEREILMSQMTRNVYAFGFNYFQYEGSIEMKKEDLEREAKYMSRNFEMSKKRVGQMIHIYHEPTDKAILKELLERASKLKKDQRIKAVDVLLKGRTFEQAVEALYEKGFSFSLDEILKGMDKESSIYKNDSSLMMQFVVNMYTEFKSLEDKGDERNGKLDSLQSRLVDVKKLFYPEQFIPDANSTYRFTSGRKKGYSPSDGIYARPVTTLTGVIEKNQGGGDFNAPEKLIKLWENRDFGMFMDKRLKDVPVDLLYDADTTGGNSGSPIMDKDGKLVGINFDRAFEATINDFAWNESYSRSIGVDIRYVLFILEKFAGAERLLGEMNLK